MSGQIRTQYNCAEAETTSAHSDGLVDGITAVAGDDIKLSLSAALSVAVASARLHYTGEPRSLLTGTR